MSARWIAETMAARTMGLLMQAETPEAFVKTLADTLQVVAEEETKREREACAVICDAMAKAPTMGDAAAGAERIRARGAS